MKLWLSAKILPIFHELTYLCIWFVFLIENCNAKSLKNPYSEFKGKLNVLNSSIRWIKIGKKTKVQEVLKCGYPTQLVRYHTHSTNVRGSSIAIAQHTCSTLDMLICGVPVQRTLRGLQILSLCIVLFLYYYFSFCVFFFLQALLFLFITKEG